MLREAKVAHVETLSPHFRLIDLEGAGLRGVSWTPGQKLQVMLGAGLLARTYTPMLWDAERGATRLLAYAHGDGPGSHWGNAVALDDIVRFFGPRRSLDLAGLASPTLFGDETSFALAASLGTAARFVFEVDSAEECRPVLEALGLAGATLVERQPGDAHLGAVEAILEGSNYILTGKAGAIQRLSRTLKARGVAPSAIRAKAYWAPGKRGLD
jgi:NADPH-dependent ferric siderophore reductase